MYDILIQNGTIIDGSGADSFPGDIAIKDGKIAAVGRLAAQEAVRVIDAAGLTVIPGMFDIHSHGDCSLPMFPGMDNYIAQGITTIFGGHCGLGIAPIDKYYNYIAVEGPAIAAMGEEPAQGFDPGGVTLTDTARFRQYSKQYLGYETDWTNYGSFLAHLRKETIGGNFCGVVGHGSIRSQVMGADWRREATDAEIEEMKRYLIEALEGGAMGLSFSFDYDPDDYTSHHEALELAKCLKDYPHSILTCHTQTQPVRCGKSTPDHRRIDGYIELMEIGLETGIHVHLSHISAAYPYESGNEAAAEESARKTLETIEEYKARGCNVTFDVIPPDCGGPFYFPQAAIRLLPCVKECGGMTGFGRRLREDSAYRQHLLDMIYSGRSAEICLNFPPFRLTPDTSNGWDAELIILQCTNPDYVGKSLHDLEEANHCGAPEALLDLLAEDPYVFAYPLYHGAKRGEQILIDHPECSIGYDNLSFSFTYQKNAEDYPMDVPHPNCYNAAVKYLTRCGQPRFEDTVRRVTSRPAEILGLSDRGLLREGMAADITILDRSRLDPKENLLQPRTAPDGIRWVVVNGVVALEDGQLTGSRSGKVFSAPRN